MFDIQSVGGAARIMTSTPERFAAYIKSEQVKWRQAIKDTGARVD